MRYLAPALLLSVGLLLGALLLPRSVSFAGVDPDRQNMPRWEYRIISVKTVAGGGVTFDDLIRTNEADFNRIGLLGWELVSVSDGFATFKRELR